MYVKEVDVVVVEGRIIDIVFRDVAGAMAG